MEDLDALVRRVDEDRWLAARFAPRRDRARLIAFYALNYEIARTAETVTQGALGDIRLAWWRDAVEEIYAGQAPRAHPVVYAFAEAVAERRPPADLLIALIAARARDLQAEPFATWAELEAYVDATAGGAIRVAGALLGGVPERFAREAGRAWGYVGLLRAATFWAARGRRLAPVDMAPEAANARLRNEAGAALARAREAAAKLPAAAFPSFGYLALVRGYLRALERGQRAQTPLLLRQFALVGASASGRL